MTEPDRKTTPAAGAPPPAFQRKAVRISDSTLTRGHLLEAGGSLPWLIEPTMPTLRLVPWATANRSAIEPLLSKHGAVLFRGFAGNDSAELERLIQAVSGELLEYVNRSTPRSRVQGRIFTSTEYPANETIPLHNEMSYTRRWAQKLFFACLVAPMDGGETPIADSRRVLERIPTSVRERFMRCGVMYVRNYDERVDVPWQEVFQTEDPAQVEAYCRDAGLVVEWRPNRRLRTSQVCQATVLHPKTGERVWFNQAHLFHYTSLAPEVRDSLLSMFELDELPRNAYFGDGAPIEPSHLEAVREAFELEQVAFKWQDGDVLMLDNVLAAHGRRPYSGPRQIIVGMSSPVSPEHVPRPGAE